MSRLFALIGYPLSHSFSKKYFTDKFEQEQIPNSRYELFPLENIEQLPKLLNHHPDLEGLNVTIPYKQSVLPFLDALDEGAAAVGAVNTIQVRDGKLKGFNTDVIGFEHSLLKLLKGAKVKALILGTGGAAKAVAFVLKNNNIPYIYVSRTKKADGLTYEEVDQNILQQYQLIVNTTPLGMTPKAETCPALPYTFLSSNHYLYDLVYNPAETLFLKQGRERGAAIANGLEMLHLQAEASWSIWNSP